MRNPFVPVIVAGAVACAASCSGAASVLDPVSGIPAAQQRAATQQQFGQQWPFKAETATLACVDGAAVARVEGTDYALNDAAKARGYAAAPDSLIRPRPPKWPSNPVQTIRQEQRQAMFVEVTHCRAELYPAGCLTGLTKKYQVTDAQLQQIDVEGHERMWAPLPPEPQSLEPLADTALKLCPPGR